MTVCLNHPARVGSTLAGLVFWWISRMKELLPRSWSTGPADGIVIETDQTGVVSVWLRQKQLRSEVTLAAATRLAERKRVFLRPAPELVLEKHHAVPTLGSRLDYTHHSKIAAITMEAA